MEGVNQSTNKNEVKMEDVTLFGLFLLQVFEDSKKKKGDIAKELGVSSGTLVRWQSGEMLPAEDKLAEIARICSTDEEELKRVYGISRKARDLEISSNKNNKRKVKTRNFWDY